MCTFMLRKRFMTDLNLGGSNASEENEGQFHIPYFDTKA